MLAVSRVIGHKEWAPGRKTDPLYDMNWRRSEVAAFTPGGGFLMALSDAEQAELFASVRYLKDAVLNGGPDASPSGRALKDLIQAAADQTAGVFRPDDEHADPATGLVSLRQEVADTKTGVLTLLGRPISTTEVAIDEGVLAEHLKGVLGQLSDADVARIAAAVTDEQASRLARPDTPQV